MAITWLGGVAISLNTFKSGCEPLRVRVYLELTYAFTCSYDQLIYPHPWVHSTEILSRLYKLISIPHTSTIKRRNLPLTVAAEMLFKLNFSVDFDVSCNDTIEYSHMRIC